jgi:hypothetical protein
MCSLCTPEVRSQTTCSSLKSDLRTCAGVSGSELYVRRALFRKELPGETRAMGHDTAPDPSKLESAGAGDGSTPAAEW